MKKNYYTVYAVFDEKYRRTRQCLSIPSKCLLQTRVLIREAVKELLDPADVRHLIGVVDKFGKWVD